MKHIIIEGFIGSGKSKVGKALAKEMELPYLDLDKMITKKLNMSVNDVFERFGEAFFRAMETMELKGLLEEKKRHVLVIGSGTALMEQNEPYIHKLGKVVYIKYSVGQLAKRMEEAYADDPFFKEGKIKEQVTRLLKEREPSYEKLADYVIQADKLTQEEILEQIQEKVK